MASKSIIRVIALVLPLTLLANDPWKGDDYAKNSASQEASAFDFLQKTALQGCKAVLDIGCGDGKITAKMAQTIPDGTVIGLDISPSMIDHAKRTFAEQKNLQFVCLDAAAVAYKHQFDMITSFTVMHWVLDQKKALEGFREALKPGGRLCIQMPTALPAPMEKALDKVLKQERWKPYFVGFQAPWKFYSSEEYAALLVETRLYPQQINVTTKDERFPSRAVFEGFLKQWFPYLRPLPAELKEQFLTELLDRYLELQPLDEQGGVHFIVDRLEVEANSHAPC